MNKNNSVYLYDYSFLSLLNLIKKLVQINVIPYDIKNKDYQANLFEDKIYLKIDEDEKVIKDIINKLGTNIFNTIYKIYLSNDKYKEITIYYFFVYSLKYKNKVFYMRNLKSINKALKISKYVGNEIHKFKGFLRFKELENKVLYATMAPENNIILFLAKHFKNRLKNEYWIIHDVKRKILSIYDKKNYYFINADDFKLSTNNLSKDEEDIQNLWKMFYKTISIKERKNDRCRINFMPKKYWKYIIEVSDEDEKDN